MNFTLDDIARIRLMQKIIKEGKFEIQGSAVNLTALTFKWLDELEERIVYYMKKDKPIEVKKDVKQSRRRA